MDGNKCKCEFSPGSVYSSGYEACSELDDDDDDMLSLSGRLITPTFLPDFWLILRVFMDHVMVYFHTRFVLLICFNIEYHYVMDTV